MIKFLKCFGCKTIEPFKYYKAKSFKWLSKLYNSTKQWMRNLFKGYKTGEKLFTPVLSGEELKNISEAQAKIIYDEAKNILKDNRDSIKSLATKAEVIFKYLFTVQSALCGLCLWLVKSPDFKSVIILPNLYLLLLGFALLLIPIFIYMVIFLNPIATKGANNPPTNTLKEKATREIATFYLCEAVAIQRHAIPFNENVIKSKVKWLRAMVFISIIAILVVLLAIFVG